MSVTNRHGESFAVGDRVNWDTTQESHVGVIQRFLSDGSAVVLSGPYETAYVDVNSLYRKGN